MFEAQLDKHIRMIYDTVNDSMKWHQFLVDIAQSVGLKSNLLMNDESRITNTKLTHGDILTCQEERYLNKLTPHIKRALAIHQKLESNQFTIQLEQAVQITLGQFFLLIDANKKIVSSDRFLRERLDKDELVCLQGDSLESIEGIKTLDLKDAIHTVTQHDSTELSPSSIPFIVHLNKDNKEQLWLVEIRPFNAIQIPIQNPFLAVTNEHLAQITFQELSKIDDELPDRLGKFYRLSPSEVDVAILLAGGHSPAEIAEKRARSVDTIRSQIKQVTAKMGVKKTTELIVLVNEISL